MKTNLKTLLITLTLCAVTPAKAPASSAAQPEKWISLYLGREAQFQEALTQKIKAICDSYGVPYQLTNDRLIMVPAKARPSILVLIAGNYKR